MDVDVISFGKEEKMLKESQRSFTEEE